MVTVRPQISEREMGQLFSAPEVAVQLLWACQGAIFSPSDLKKIILQDSVFCAKVLNAALKSCPELIDPSAPLTSALEGLSLPVIKSLAIQSAKRLVETSFSAAQVQFMRELWFYSQASSITSAYLAEAISYPAPEEAQLAGLFQNIGMLTLFSQKPERYLNDIGSSLSSREVRGQERISFESDHLQAADALISGWQFESFMADAIRYSQLDIDQYRESNALIRIVRLALEICRSPFALNDEILSAAKTLFGFTKNDTSYLFKLAENHYRELSPFNAKQDDGLEEIAQIQRRLSSVVFSIADQESIRSQLADSDKLETFVKTARHLYLRNSAAKEALFFRFDPQNSLVSGVAASEQTGLISGLSTSLEGGSLLAEALQRGEVQHSFSREDFAPSVFDRQLIEFCKDQGIVCLPLQIKGQLLGGVVLGIKDIAEAEFLISPQIQLLTESVAKALTSLTAVQTEVTQAQTTRSETDLIPKLVHEVSNPLTIINNYVGAVGSLLEGTEHAEIFPAIETEISRIGEILKYYAELKETPHRPDVLLALNGLIHSVVDSLKPTFFMPHNIEIITDFDNSLPPIKTKEVVIKQILVNLLKNAAEALVKDGKISLTTREYRTSDGQHYIEIRVQDNGPGIDKTIQNRLFSPVTSTKGSGHAGLGLSIIKGMVDDIGAQISCQSSAEFGSCFNLLLPISDE